MPGFKADLTAMILYSFVIALIKCLKMFPKGFKASAAVILYSFVTPLMECLKMLPSGEH